MSEYYDKAEEVADEIARTWFMDPDEGKDPEAAAEFHDLRALVTNILREYYPEPERPGGVE